MTKALIIVCQTWAGVIFCVSCVRAVCVLCVRCVRADVDSNGVLSLDEFLAVIRHVRPAGFESESVRMFREACVLTEDRNRKRLMGALSLGKHACVQGGGGGGGGGASRLARWDLALAGSCYNFLLCSSGCGYAVVPRCPITLMCYAGNGSEEAEIDVTSFLEVSRKFGLSTVKLAGGRDLHDVRCEIHLLVMSRCCPTHVFARAPGGIVFKLSWAWALLALSFRWCRCRCASLLHTGACACW